MSLAVKQMLFRRFWETMRCLIYDFKDAQLLGFHVATPQLPPRKVPAVFLVWFSKKVVKFKIYGFDIHENLLIPFVRLCNPVI